MRAAIDAGPRRDCSRAALFVIDVRSTLAHWRIAFTYASHSTPIVNVRVLLFASYAERLGLETVRAALPRRSRRSPTR